MTKSRHILLAVFAFTAPLPAQTDDAAFLAQFEKTFEAGGNTDATLFVPPELMTGRLHRVSTHAYNDGLRNTYFLYAGREEIEVTGTPALVERIREIYALDHLRGVSKSEEFGKALAKSAEGKVESAIGVVKDPFGTIKRVPKGASRFFGRIGEGLKGGASSSEDRALAGITGVSKAKAQLAAKLGVSPYTTNEELQQELASVARASAGGGLVVDLAGAAVGGPAISALGWNQTLQDTLVNSTPDGLRIINRKKLLALGVERALADEFLMHPWFSPWHETITTDALARIGVNPTAFLNDAVKALTPDDAFFFQRLAQILARYAAEGAPLRAILFEGGIVTALDRDGTLVVPVSLDYAIWAERTARRAEEFTAIDKSRGDIKARALWTDGRVSDRLREEFKTRSISIHENVLAAHSR